MMMMRGSVLVVVLSYAGLLVAANEFSPPYDVEVNCKTLKDEYIAIVTWKESEDALLKAGIFMYQLQYESSIQPGRWRSRPVDSIGRAFMKLAPGATYKFRVIGMSPKGASRPSEEATGTCTF